MKIGGRVGKKTTRKNRVNRRGKRKERKGEERSTRGKLVHAMIMVVNHKSDSLLQIKINNKINIAKENQNPHTRKHKHKIQQSTQCNWSIPITRAAIYLSHGNDTVRYMTYIQTEIDLLTVNKTSTKRKFELI